ncbi:hypothetical protein CA54_19890 [Symmachiella macrocystis]|uniref:Uncharacterized protein n=1 Tax=Symmachiella macrocystis TaxID=2527985 RepID=A0A5C6BLV7_9PLAN|nr:hypothetical protein [Symmachiella macrocystis]TWU13163.1 hypothetical protein CA54_19890 [Symmachiella macrocystis]
MGKRLATPYHEKLQSYADEYIKETGNVAISTKDLAVWAIKTDRWEPPPDLVVRICREDFAKALREQSITDKHGHPVRANHVARITKAGKQLHLWSDIRRAPRRHMEIAFTQRREQIVGDCRQLKRDLDYYNDIHPGQKPIQKCFDFRDDVVEGDFPDEMN